MRGQVGAPENSRRSVVNLRTESVIFSSWCKAIKEANTSTTVQTNTMGISSEELQNLLSLDAATRKAAEAKLQSASVSDRIVAFIHVLANPSHQGALLHLSAVLLRRDILTMNAADDLNTLQELMGALLQAFGSVDANTKTAVGNCLAEIVAVLDVSENTKGLGNIAISQILGAAGESVSFYSQPYKPSVIVFR